MFPDIQAGHIIAIDGSKWLVTMRLPDAFVLTGLGEGNDRTIKLPFEDLERIRAAGLLSIEGPLKPRVPEAKSDDAPDRAMFEAFLRLESLGLAERSHNGIRQVMPILMEVRGRHDARARQEGRPASAAHHHVRSEKEFRDELRKFEIREVRKRRPSVPLARALPKVDPRVARIATQLTVDCISGERLINQAFVDDLRREAVGLVVRPSDGKPYAPISDLVSRLGKEFARKRGAHRAADDDERDSSPDNDGA